MLKQESLHGIKQAVCIGTIEQAKHLILFQPKPPQAFVKVHCVSCSSMLCFQIINFSRAKMNTRGAFLRPEAERYAMQFD